MITFWAGTEEERARSAAVGDENDIGVTERSVYVADGVTAVRHLQPATLEQVRRALWSLEAALTADRAKGEAVYERLTELMDVSEGRRRGG